MTDREKVIKGLECCANDKPFYHAHCDECPYNGRKPDNMGGCTKLYRDVLELLKEQELVKPEVLVDTWICGNCKTRLERQAMIGPNVLISENFNYCPSCGRKVNRSAD